MDELWMAYAAAVTLGAAHALEVDHMVAVSAFVGGHPRMRAAVSFGIRWGVGHSAVVLVVGALLAWSGLAVPPSLQLWGETVVGLALMAVGVWAWRNARRIHVHGPASHGDHAHLHSHGHVNQAHEHPHGRATVPGHRHAHLSTLVGAIHGLAGTAPIVALMPVTLMPTLDASIGYLIAFGAGTTIAMGGYAAVAALAVSRASSSVAWARRVALVTAAASVAVGAWWVLRSTMGEAG